MKKVYIFLIIAFSLVLTGCQENKIITKKDCLEKGLAFKSVKKLNYRSGKYELKGICEKS